MTVGARPEVRFSAIESDRDPCDSCGGPHRDWKLVVGWVVIFVCVGCAAAIRDALSGADGGGGCVSAEDLPAGHCERWCDGCLAKPPARLVRFGPQCAEVCARCAAAIRDRVSDALAARPEVQ